MRIETLRPCACGCHYDTERWTALHLFTRLTAAQVAPLVDPWPAHVVIEVRICGNCKRKVSRLQDAVRGESVRSQAIAA